MTTVTLHEGDTPVEFLRYRIAMILEKNLWLTSRLVKRNTTDGVVSLAYNKTIELEPVVQGGGCSDRNRRTRRRSGHSFALVVSMNHTLGDGHTYYKLYSMLSADAEVEALNPVRVADFEEAKTEIIGEKENSMFTSAGLGLGIMGTYVGSKLTRRGPQNVCIHIVDPAWVSQEKAKTTILCSVGRYWTRR